jgi:hypothetical protein
MSNSSRFGFFGGIILLIIGYFWWIQTLPAPQATRSNPPASVALLQAIEAKSQADNTPKIGVKAGVVQVRIHSILSTSVPLSALVAALTQFPQISHFRVTWGSYGRYYASKSAVLYDRSQRTLLYFSRGRDMCGNFSEHTAFLRVSDKVLVRDANDYPQAASRPCGGVSPCADDTPFIHLSEYDCVRHDLSRWFYPA